MALSQRAALLISQLAKRGDIFAKEMLHKVTHWDQVRLRSWAKRRDLMAQRLVKGVAGASPAAKALMNRLARAGEHLAQKTNTLTTEKASQTITFTAPATASVADSPLTLTAPSSSSGLPVALAVASGPATLAGLVLTLTGEGSVVVRATQAGNDNYDAATPVQRTITVSA